MNSLNFSRIALLATSVALLTTALPSQAEASRRMAFAHHYPDLDWKVIRTEHFNVFYPVSKDPNSAHPVDANFTGRKTAYVAEEMYPVMCGQFNFYLDETVNIVMLDQTDDLTGYTIPNFDWIVVSGRHSDNLWRLRGQHDWLRVVLYHEFAHVVSLKADQTFAEESFGVSVGARWTDGALNTDVNASMFIGTGDPWWWVEGGAEYYTDVAGINQWSANRDMRMRMDALAGTYLDAADFGDYFGSNGGFDGNRHYMAGYAFNLYLEERFGPGITQSFGTKRAEKGWGADWVSIVEDVMNISYEELYDDWIKWSKEKYGKVRDEIMKDPAIGQKLALGLSPDYWSSHNPADREKAEWVRTNRGNGPDQYWGNTWQKDREKDGLYNNAARFSPDGSRMAVSNGWAGVSVYGLSEGDLPGFTDKNYPEAFGETPQEWLAGLDNWKADLKSAGDGQADFSPDGKKIVMPCYEDMAMTSGGMVVPEFSKLALLGDGYDWHALCIVDLEAYENAQKEIMADYFGDKDPVAEDAELAEKAMRSPYLVDFEAEKKQRGDLKGKKAQRRWMDWQKDLGKKWTKYAPEIVKFIPGNHTRANDPACSPDGKSIAYTRYDDGTQNLWVIDAETGEGGPITSFDDGTHIDGIDWSPDGQQLVWAAWRWNQGDIYVIDKDGSNGRPITLDSYEDRDPHWGHDGNIYFASERVGAIFNIFRINPRVEPGRVDTDLDGVPDDEDQCPEDAEVWNNFRDNDGCPDGNPVQVTADGVELAEQIFFEIDTAEIKPASMEVLDFVVAALKSGEGRRIKKLAIHGHTDSSGEADYNLELSQKRAAAVRLYLVSKGIDSDRLVSEGFGDTQPITEGETAEDLAKNRRVEMLTQEFYSDAELAELQQASVHSPDVLSTEVTQEELDARRLENAYLVQITNVVGGAFTPWLTPTGNLLYVGYEAFGWKPYGLRADEFYNKVVDDTTLDIKPEDFGLDRPQEVYPSYEEITEVVPSPFKYFRNPAIIPIIQLGNVSRSHIGFNLGMQLWMSDVLDTNDVILVALAGEDLMAYLRWTHKSLWPDLYFGGMYRRIKFDYAFNLDKDGSATTTDDQFLGDLKGTQSVFGGFAGVTLPISRYFEVDISTFQYGLAFTGVTDGKQARGIRYKAMQNVSASLTSKGLRGGSTGINPRGGRAVSFAWSPNVTVPLNVATSGVDSDDGQLFGTYYYNEFGLTWTEYIKLPFKSETRGDLGHTLQTEVQIGIIDRNVPWSDEIRGGGSGGVNIRNPYASNTVFSGYQPYSLSGETAALLNLQYRFPLARNIDKKVGGLYFEDVYAQVFGTVGNFWSYRVDENAKTTRFSGEEILADKDARVGGHLTPADGLVREWPGMEASENGNYLLADVGVEVRLAANLFNRSSFFSSFKIAYGFMPTAGRGDVNGDDIYTNSSDPTLGTRSDEREPAGFRFYLNIGTGW